MLTALDVERSPDWNLKMQYYGGMVSPFSPISYILGPLHENSHALLSRKSSVVHTCIC